MLEGSWGVGGMDGWMAEQKTAKAGEEGPSARTAENVPTIVVHQASWLLAVGCGRDFGGEHVLRQLSGRVFLSGSFFGVRTDGAGALPAL